MIILFYIGKISDFTGITIVLQFLTVFFLVVTIYYYHKGANREDVSRSLLLSFYLYSAQMVGINYDYNLILYFNIIVMAITATFHFYIGIMELIRCWNK